MAQVNDGLRSAPYLPRQGDRGQQPSWNVIKPTPGHISMMTRR